MSLTGILDLDREILRYVEDLQLLKVCSINKKMWDSVCNEAFLRRRLNKYPEIEKYRNTDKDDSLVFRRCVDYVCEYEDNNSNKQTTDNTRSTNNTQTTDNKRLTNQQIGDIIIRNCRT